MWNLSFLCLFFFFFFLFRKRFIQDSRVQIKTGYLLKGYILAEIQAKELSNANLHCREEYFCSLQGLLDEIVWPALGSRSD